MDFKDEVDSIIKHAMAAYREDGVFPRGSFRQEMEELLNEVYSAGYCDGRDNGYS